MQFEIRIIFQNETQNLLEYVHFQKILSYSSKLNTKKFDVLKKLDLFLITYCKRFHPQNPLYEKVKMNKKKDYSP